MKLSVIIPVYQVEQTLEQCVGSVLQQEFEDMEIILVDDASPDKCPQICDKLQQEHSNIRTIHQQNGGLSAARNTGIREAKGEFITFVDSDDWLERETIRPLIDFLNENPDIDLLEYPADIKNSIRLQLDEKVYDNAIDYWKQTRAFEHTYAWNKVYRTSLFKDVTFPEGKVFEDVWTLPQLLQKANTVATTNRGLYYYRDNPSGITAKAKGNELTSLLEAHLSSPFPTPLIHLLNIQLDVYRHTGKVLLPDGLPINGKCSLTDKIKLLIYKHLGINRLCKMHKILKGH
ncbi:MAG: glycosyltransferase family 2 protein [Prevotella sp.]|nr:glycosyltransferase family 2 protein [Prevotella sp.]